MTSYLKTVAIGLDDFAASIFLNRNDLTISAACGLVRRNTILTIPLHVWQQYALRGIGAGLEFFWPGHCEGAIKNDTARANSTVKILS